MSWPAALVVIVALFSITRVIIAFIEHSKKEPIAASLGLELDGREVARKVVDIKKKEQDTQ